MPLLNSTQGPGILFGSTVVPGLNVSGRAVGYGQVICPDQFKLDGASTSVTPGLTTGAWANFRDAPAEAATNVRRLPTLLAGIVMDKKNGGIPDDGPINVLLEGYPLCWVRRTAANAAPAIYDAIGSPLSLELNTTNVVRCLSSGISAVLAAGGPGLQRPIGVCETVITATVATIDAAEGATGFPMLPTGPAGTVFAMTNYQIQLADVLFDGVFGLR